MFRILRCLVCFLLIACILVNLSPLKIHAMELMTVGFATVPVAVAVACAMQALGVMSASDSAGFTSTVDSCSNWLTDNSSFVVNGTVALLGLTQSGNTVSYLNKDFVQTIWEWLFQSESVSSSPFSFGSLAEEAYEVAVSYPYYVVGYYFGNLHLAWANVPIVVKTVDSNGITWLEYRNNTDNTTTAYNSLWHYYYGDSKASTRGNNAYFHTYTLYTGSSSRPLFADSGLDLGQIESPFLSTGTEEETIQIEIAPIYIDWTKYGVPDPNDPGGDDPDNDGKYPMWLPTGIPSVNYDDSVITQTQQQAQSGTVTGDLTFTPTDTSTGNGNGSGDNTGTDSGNSGNTGSTWKPPSDPTHFKLVDLSKFFPFCIPFDLFDFFKLLNADPVAPSFTWEIQDLSGQTYGLTVDLSQWDSVAQLFRRLQLFLFVCGLAAASRKLIKW